jgi:hypothetical protein
MSYYPILMAPGCSGYTTLFNYAPNNWEESQKRDRFVHLTWSDGEHWQSRSLGTLEYGATKTVRAGDIAGMAPENAVLLLSLSDISLPQQADNLPTAATPHSSYPNWRATLGLTAESDVSTCYQGEIDPFPSPGSMLSFGHFLQVSEGVENYLLLVNLEANPQVRVSLLEARDAFDPSRLLTSAQIRNNSVNIIRLDWPGMDEEQLPMLVCREMSGIPLYFARTADGSHLSLEHTHPPASSVVHGRRWEAQKILKRIWFSKADIT